MNAKEFLAFLELDGYVHRVFCLNKVIKSEKTFVRLLLQRSSSIPETQKWMSKEGIKELEKAAKEYYF